MPLCLSICPPTCQPLPPGNHALHKLRLRTVSGLWKCSKVWRESILVCGSMQMVGSRSRSGAKRRQTRRELGCVGSHSVVVPHRFPVFRFFSSDSDSQNNNGMINDIRSPSPILLSHSPPPSSSHLL